MLTGALRQDENAKQNEHRNNRRSDRSAQRHSPLAERFVEKISGSGAERARQDEGSPKQRHARYIREVIKRRKDGKAETEQ
jgi:hypothetical protein